MEIKKKIKLLLTRSPLKPEAAIFLSYRRSDAAGHAGRLYDNLCSKYGENRLFIDVGSVGLGKNFIQVIDASISVCNILVVLISKGWLNEHATRTNNKNWNNNEKPLQRYYPSFGDEIISDYCFLEIALAIDRGVTIIPVLLQGANLPSPEELPEKIRGLSYLNAFLLSDLNWNSGVNQLFKLIDAEVIEQKFRSLEKYPLRRFFLLYQPHNLGGFISRLFFYFYTTTLLLMLIAGPIVIAPEYIKNGQPPFSAIPLAFVVTVFGTLCCYSWPALIAHEIAVYYDKKIH